MICELQNHVGDWKEKHKEHVWFDRNANALFVACHNLDGPIFWGVSLKYPEIDNSFPPTDWVYVGEL